MKLTKGISLPIVNQTAYIHDGWATSDNLEVRLSVKTNIKGEGVIDLTQLAKIKGGFDSAEIRDGFLFVKKGNAVSKFKLIGKIDEFPSDDNYPEYLGEVTENDTKAIISLVPFSGNDINRPAMTGVYIGENDIAATDAHILRWMKKDAKFSDVIIPKMAAMIMMPEQYIVTASEKRHRLMFMNESEMLSFRLIDGIYPKYKAVIPDSSEVQAKCKSSDLKQAITNALPNSGKNNFIEFVFRNGKLLILTSDPDMGKEYSEEIEATLTGASTFPIGFNGKYLQMCLDSEYSIFEMTSINKAAIINSNTLLMPVLIENSIYKHERVPEDISIQNDSEIGKISHEPKPEVIEEAIEETSEETSEDLPELLTVIENVTEKAFGVVGYTELLPEDFRNKYGSKCKILVGEERREGFLFSKKRRAQLDEAIAEIGIAYHVA